MKPSYGLAGSNATRCLEDLNSAREAVGHALEAVVYAAPNRRDFIGRDADWDAALARYERQRSDLIRIDRELLEQAIWASDAIR